LDSKKLRPHEARKLNVKKLNELISKKYKLGKVDLDKLESGIRKLINENTQMRIPESERMSLAVLIITFLIRVKAIFIDKKGYVDLEKILGIKKDGK